MTRWLLLTAALLCAQGARAGTFIGSVPLCSAADTQIFISSNNATSAIGGAGVFLSSHTTAVGKTFYLQHFEATLFENAATTSTIANAGSMTVFNSYNSTTGGTKASSMTFTYNGGPLPRIWVMDFAEPKPFPSATTFIATVTANTATALTWITNAWGCEK